MELLKSIGWTLVLVAVPAPVVALYIWIGYTFGPGWVAGLIAGPLVFVALVSLVHTVRTEGDTKDDRREGGGW